MLINQLSSHLLKHVAVCLFNNLLAHFLIKGDNAGSFPVMANLAVHRLSSTTTLKIKTICNACFVWQFPPFSLLRWREKYRHGAFFSYISTLLTPIQVKDRRREVGETFIWKMENPTKVNNHTMIPRIILWRGEYLRKAHTNWSTFPSCSAAGLE